MYEKYALNVLNQRNNWDVIVWGDSYPSKHIVNVGVITRPYEDAIKKIKMDRTIKTQCWDDAIALKLCNWWRTFDVFHSHLYYNIFDEK